MPCLALQAAKPSVVIRDNTGNKYLSNIYIIRNDSLIITGKADGGKTAVDYMQRKLTGTEMKQLANFFQSFAVDSIAESYFGDYTNFEYISADHFPRVINIEIEVNGRHAVTTVTNAFVTRVARLFTEINKLLPAEVMIRYEEGMFSRSYP
jgi:hypothetical protein